MPFTTTIRYADARHFAGRDRVAMLPAWRWWLAPLCWIRSHRWPADGPVLLTHALCYCRRCGEEFDARVE